MSTFRLAGCEDAAAIAEIYNKIHTQEELGLVTIGWKRDIYPNVKTAQEAIEQGDMFVQEMDGQIVGSGRINQEQVPEYANASWEYDAEAKEVMVLHTLTIDPDQARKGLAQEFVSFYEQYAFSHGCRFLRIDTNEINTRARALYRKLGYKEVSIVPCVFNGIEGVNLVCLEKYLDL